MSNPDDQPSNVLPVSAVTRIQMITDNSPANGQAENTAIASLDNAGSYKNDIYFTFTITKGNAVFTQTSQQTINVKANPAFVASVSFTDHTSETGEIEVYPVVNQSLSAKTAYSFKAGLPQKNKLSLSAPTDNAVADGLQADIVTALVTDSMNGPLSGQAVEFTLPTDSRAAFGNGQSSQTVTTNGNGQASVSVTLKSEQDAIIPISCSLLSDPSVSQSIDVHFKAIPQKRQLTLTLQPLSDNAVANGIDINAVGATLLDQNNAPVAGEVLNFSFSPQLPTVSFYGGSSTTSSTTNINGTTLVSITDRSQAADTITVNATLASDPTVRGSTQIHFTTATPTKRQLTLTLRPLKDNAAANGTDINTISATLLDQNNAPVMGEVINFNLLPQVPNISFVGGSTTTSSTTDGNGVAVVSINDRSQRADTVTVNATLASDATVKSSTQVHFTAVAQPPSSRSINLALSRNGATQTCSYPTLEPARTARVFVYVRNGSGAPLSQQLVYLSVQVNTYTQPRIVGIQNLDVAPTPYTTAVTDINGVIQVNIALWRGPQFCYGTVTLFANFNNYQYSGPSISMYFSE